MLREHTSGIRGTVTGGILVIIAVVALTAGRAFAVDSMPAPATHVALLEAECIGVDSNAFRRELAGWLDTVLTDCLTREKSLALVDRQALDKVLAEKVLSAGGAAAVRPKDVAQSLRPFWSAGVLVCPVVSSADPAKGDNGKLIISLQAVAAQSGQVLAEAFIAGKWQDGKWQGEANAIKTIERFCEQVSAAATSKARLPLVEVCQVQLAGGKARLQWMADDLSDSLRGPVIANLGCQLLVPRHASSTREERLLRVMGLAKARDGDSTAALSPAPMARLTAQLREKPGKDVTFLKTPIMLHLDWTANGKTLSTDIAGTVGGGEKLRSQAIAWVRQQLKGISAASSSSGDDDETCRALSQQELVAIHQIIEVLDASGQPGSWRNGWYQTPANQGMRVAIGQHAFRAMHLDPTNEEAAYFAVTTIDAPYFIRGQERSFACVDRTILEGQRYLDRFGKTVTYGSRAYSVMSQIGSAGFAGIDQSGRTHPAETYRYASTTLLARARGTMLEITNGVRIEDNVWGLARSLNESLFMVCPMDELESQRQRWRDFWAKSVESLKRDDLPTWDYASLGYHVRKKDVAALHAAMQRLDNKGAVASRWLFEGQGSSPRSRVYLRLAGDPDWATWKPRRSKAGVYSISEGDWDQFFGKIQPHLGRHWNNFPPVILTAQTTFSLPEELVKYGRAEAISGQSPAEALCFTDKEMWLSTPGRLGDQPASNAKSDTHLYTIARDIWEGKSGTLKVQPVAIDWPAISKGPGPDASKGANLVVRCVLARGKGEDRTVWIGTVYHGLAKFSRSGGEWVGRWIASKEGLPGLCIKSINECVYDGKVKLLVQAAGGEVAGGSFVVVDPVDLHVTIVGDTNKQAWGAWAAEMADGTVVPVDLCTPVRYPKADFKQIRKIISFPGMPYATGDFFCSDEAVGRIFVVYSGQMWELDVRTLQLKTKILGPYHIDGICFDDKARDMLRFRHGRNSPCWLLPTSPEVFYGNTVWNGRFWGIEDGMLVGFLPPTPGAAEQWVGPLKFDKQWNVVVMTVMNQGQELWLSTNSGDIYRVLPSEILARCKDYTYSTSQWQKEYAKRLPAANWINHVAMQIGNGDTAGAIATLDSRPDNSPARLYRALALARDPKRRGEGAAVYQQIVDDQQADPPERALAAVNLVRVHHVMGQYKAALHAAGRLAKMFPDLAPRNVTGDALNDLIDDARAKLGAASQAASGRASK